LTIVAISDKWFLLPKAAFAATVILGYAFPKRAMEMTPWKSLRDYHIATASTAGVFRNATAREAGI
jgi:hypothetical protein